MEPSINYVVSLGEGGNPKDDLLHKQQGGRGSKIVEFETTYIVYGRPLLGFLECNEYQSSFISLYVVYWVMGRGQTIYLQRPVKE